MQVKDTQKLEKIMELLNEAQDLANGAIDLEDAELRGTFDVYAQIGDVMFSVEDLLK